MSEIEVEGTIIDPTGRNMRIVINPAATPGGISAITLINHDGTRHPVCVNNNTIRDLISKLVDIL